jgi:hypothetical protein
VSPHAGTAALVKARAQADQQRAHGDATFDRLVIDAARLLRRHPASDVWAMLAHEIARQLGCHDTKAQVAAEMLASLAVHRAEVAR